MPPACSPADQPDVQLHAFGGREADVLVDSPGGKQIVRASDVRQSEPARQAAVTQQAQGIEVKPAIAAGGVVVGITHDRAVRPFTASQAS